MFYQENLFHGNSTALVTPFRDGKPDLSAIEKIAQKNMQANVSALFLFGSTGEHFSLTDAEKRIIFFCVKEITRGKIPLVCGVGSPSTKKTFLDALVCKNYGADGLLLLPPFYYKCSDNGVIGHFLSVMNGVKIPTVIYNVPSRTGYDLFGKTKVLNELAACSYAVAIKQAESDEERAVAFVKNSPLPVLSGSDENMQKIISSGGVGAITVAGNAFPEKTGKLCFLAKNNREEAIKYDKLMRPLFELLSLESNPVPLKFLLSLTAGIKNELRPPLLKLQEENEIKARALYERFLNNFLGEEK